MLIGYARSSTVDQKAVLLTQHDALTAVGCERLFSEQISPVAKREQLEHAIAFARDGDTFVVTRLDRLARSTQDLLNIVERLDKKGVALRILDFAGSAVDTTKAVDKLLITVFAAFAEFKRNLMLERQREGIARAKSEGKYRGRAPTARSKVDQIRAFAKDGLTKREIAERLGISERSVFRVLAMPKSTAPDGRLRHRPVQARASGSNARRPTDFHASWPLLR